MNIRDWSSDVCSSDLLFTVAKAIDPELQLSALEVSSGALPGETVTATDRKSVV